jgi:hypothetical protein
VKKNVLKNDSLSESYENSRSATTEAASGTIESGITGTENHNTLLGKVGKRAFLAAHTRLAGS